MLQIFKKRLPGTPNKADLFAVQTGDLAGEMLIYIESTLDTHCFLSIPNMVNRDIPLDKFTFATSNNIVEKVKEPLSKQVYELCVAQYKKNKAL